MAELAAGRPVSLFSRAYAMCRPMRLHLLRLGLLLAIAGGAPSSARAETPPPGADLRSRVERMLPESARGDLAFLLHLGWRLEEGPGIPAVRVVPGTPCARADLAAAQAAGDLRILLPAPATSETVARLADLLPGLVDSVPSRCAWQLRVHAAVGRATARLSANAERGRYLFPPFLVLFDSPFWDLEPPEGWVQQGKVYVASGSPSAAIEGFYEKECQAECYAAQLVATYAVQRELYGDAAFDRAFRPEELALGQPDAYLATPLGAYAVYEKPHRWRALMIPPEDQGKDVGMMLAAHGPKAFAGVTGIVRDQKGGDLSNENFMIVTVSPTANEALRTGGFTRIGVLAAEALEAYRTSRAYLAHGPVVREAERRIEEIYRDPLLSEVMVYTHPYGVVPLSHLVRAKIKRKIAAVEIWIYMNGREDAFYRRYRDAFGRGLLSAPASTPPR